jgi:bifunctional non-homologous end joining protein LigD
VHTGEDGTCGASGPLFEVMAGDKLSLYQAKRDFTKTAEPSGKAHVKPAKYPRFVIQKHAASRLHYDLRLEADGVFKSWAVTKGPSLDPSDRRLAVEVEDRPLDYGDFEGTIPQGECGGGAVMLWDRGFWAPDGGGNPERGLRKGDLKFTLAGEKLQGSWVLVRMRHDRERDRSNRNNWLLIKHRDGHEQESRHPVTDQDRSVASGRAMEEIAAGKGRRPKPFMLAGKAAASDAVWHSNRNGKTNKASFLKTIQQPKPQSATQFPHRPSRQHRTGCARLMALGRFALPAFLLPGPSRITTSRSPRTLARRTQKPFSGLW